MSWTAHIPEAPAKKAHEAIDNCTADTQLGDAESKQLAAAREVAHTLVDSKAVKGDAYEITLGGHVDPDGSTQAEYLHVQLTQWPPKETTPHGFNAATGSFDPPAEEE